VKSEEHAWKPWRTPDAFGHNADHFQRRARKAVETAEIIAGIKRCRRSTGADSRERSIGDRLLAADEFEALANQFFAHLWPSVRGCERALDAQARIVREVERVLARNRAGDVLLVGHGAVGNFVTMPVLPSIEFMTRPPGAVSASCSQDGRRLLHSWRRMEDLVAVPHRFLTAER